MEGYIETGSFANAPKESLLSRWLILGFTYWGPISIEFLHLLRSTLKFPLLNLHLKSKSIYVTSFTAMVFCYAPPSTKDSRFGIHVQGKPSGLNLDTGTVSPTFRLSVTTTNPPASNTKSWGWIVNNMLFMISFLADEQNKVVVCCKWRSDSINTIYFVGENKHVQVDQRRGDLTLGQSCSFLMNYVPSFVQIQQGTLLAPRTWLVTEDLSNLRVPIHMSSTIFSFSK